MFILPDILLIYQMVQHLLKPYFPVFTQSEPVINGVKFVGIDVYGYPPSQASGNILAMGAR
ncbi:MAG: hypothetical protein O3B37_15805, partial [Proteobacteria bacterium]|nr:hypothetical protein [Pseudomonadota bacterium]